MEACSLLQSYSCKRSCYQRGAHICVFEIMFIARSLELHFNLIIFEVTLDKLILIERTSKKWKQDFSNLRLK